MNVYKVKIGFGAGSCDDTFLVSGADFKAAVAKAMKSADVRLKDFTSQGRQIVGIEYIGEVEN